MKRRVVLCSLLALAAFHARAELPWTLHPSLPGPDGPTSAYVTSKVGPGEIRYVPPVKWIVSGARLLPPGKLQADGFAEVLPIESPAPWTDDRTRELQKEVLGKAPKDSTAVTLISAGELPFKVSNQTAYQVSFSYTYYGQQYAETVIFAEHGKMQLRFHFGCLKQDYDALLPTFMGSLFSVSGL